MLCMKRKISLSLSCLYALLKEGTNCRFLYQNGRSEQVCLREFYQNNKNISALTLCGGRKDTANDVCSSEKNCWSQVRYALLQSFLVVHHLRACLKASFYYFLAINVDMKIKALSRTCKLLARLRVQMPRSNHRWACNITLDGRGYRSLNNVCHINYFKILPLKNVAFFTFLKREMYF